MIEQVVLLAFLALFLVVVARLLVSTRGLSRYAGRHMEAVTKAGDLIELTLARALSDVPLGLHQPLPGGFFGDGQAYEVFMDVAGPPATSEFVGLTADDFRNVRITVVWKDQTGSHSAVAETYMAKVPPH